MIKLLIADDEPLICIGVQSLLNWEELGIEIVGTARNGKEAYDMIEELAPDIVIADIKMPIKSGLQLAEECHHNMGRIPLFIILTSYEDFSYARQALSVQAVDYLIKIDLSADVLKEAIIRARETLNTLKVPFTGALGQHNQQFRERFFLRLFYNLFDNEAQIALQQKELGISLTGYVLRVAYCSIDYTVRANGMNYSTYNNIIQALHETLAKKHNCYIIPLDLQNFSILFCIDEGNIRPDCPDPVQEMLASILRNTFKSIYHIFNVQIYAGISNDIGQPSQLSKGYWSAQRASHFSSKETPLVFADQLSYVDKDNKDDESYFYQMRNELKKAFEELNVESLNTILTELADSFQTHTTSRLQALNAACNILYMAISLLPGGEDTVSQIFSHETDNYCCIYHLSSVEDIAKWLLYLRDGCCEAICSKRNNYQKLLVLEVQKYIKDNLAARLSLREVASHFNFSPNYLSKIFSQHAQMRLSDYIAHERIQEAKRMLACNNMHIYEVAEALGFENAFYFSTVFKKVEGVSPKKYQGIQNRGD